jgi:hypothetical protein
MESVPPSYPKKRPRVRPTVGQQKDLIAEARGGCGWCKQPAPKLQIHHIDGDRSNTVVTNLICRKTFLWNRGIHLFPT